HRDVGTAPLAALMSQERSLRSALVLRAGSGRHHSTPDQFGAREATMGFSYIRSWLQGAVKPIRRGHCGPGPGLEVLEERSVPATFTGTHLNDTGPGSLRLEGTPPAT